MSFWQSNIETAAIRIRPAILVWLEARYSETMPLSLSSRLVRQTILDAITMQKQLPDSNSLYPYQCQTHLPRIRRPWYSFLQAATKHEYRGANGMALHSDIRNVIYKTTFVVNALIALCTIVSLKLSVIANTQLILIH